MAGVKEEDRERALRELVDQTMAGGETLLKRDGSLDPVIFVVKFHEDRPMEVGVIPPFEMPSKAAYVAFAKMYAAKIQADAVISIFEAWIVTRPLDVGLSQEDIERMREFGVVAEPDRQEVVCQMVESAWFNARRYVRIKRDDNGKVIDLEGRDLLNMQGEGGGLWSGFLAAIGGSDS